ncbi:MAG: hypothetical protein ACK455_01770 [Bacteroidota bacterium]|jgi:hypothetical protein
MRVIREFSVDEIKVSVFYMNQKFIIKFEKGNLEQNYKLSELDFMVSSDEQLEMMVKDKMIEDVRATFEKMNQNFYTTFNEIAL